MSMNEEIRMHHVAVEGTSKDATDLFFTTVLGVPKSKVFSLPPDLSQKIFGVDKSVDVSVYEQGTTKFEVFFTQKTRNHGYVHTGIQVPNVATFLERCRKHGVQFFTVQREGKELLFVRDFSGNLYEVKGPPQT